MFRITRMLVLFERLLLGLSGGALVGAHLLFWGLPFGLPIRRPNDLLPYLAFAMVSGLLATLFRERFFAVFWRVFMVFTVISVSEVFWMGFIVRIAGEDPDSFWWPASRAVQWLAVLGAVIYVVVRKASSSVKSVHRALVAAVVSVLVLSGLAWLSDLVEWYYIFHPMALSHGMAVPVIAVLATLAYVLLGLCPIFREPRMPLA